MKRPVQHTQQISTEQNVYIDCLFKYDYVASIFRVEDGGDSFSETLLHIYQTIRRPTYTTLNMIRLYET
jgi:hypothetical protein